MSTSMHLSLVDTIASDEESAEEEEEEEEPPTIQIVTTPVEEEVTAGPALSRSQKWRANVHNSLDISGDELEQAYRGETLHSCYEGQEIALVRILLSKVDF